nr:hypothetical protein [uncultured Flavobacterium sp.]
MKKQLLIITLLLIVINSFGQDTNPILTQAKTDFKKLESNFNPNNQDLLKKEEELKVLLAEISKNQDPKLASDLSTKLTEIQKLRTELNKIYQSYEAYKKVYIDKGLTIEQIDAIFKPEYKITEPLANNTEVPKVYQYYGKDLILDELKLTNDEKTNKILKTILSQKSEAYLGDIIIPKENQEFSFYINKSDIINKSDNVNKTNWRTIKSKISWDTIKSVVKKESDQFTLAGKNYKFKSVSFEICDGFFVDIKVFVFDENGSLHLFENKAPVSVLRYSTHAPNQFLVFKYPVNQKEIVTIKEFENLRIRLSDVLMYVSKAGNNYIPNDVTYDFPTKNDKDIYVNKDTSVQYEIKEDTSLQNIVELRAYTDFLGLFGKTPNGIVQLQGKGDFYMVPFLIPKLRFDLRFLDKISPYINFSRLDSISKGVETIVLPNSSITPKNSLDLIQKSYLEMGTVVNLFNLKFNKEMPFRTIGYFPARYQIADVKINDEFKNVQGFAYGFGLKFEFKRFNNFGLNYSLEWSRYSFKDFNSTATFEAPSAFNVLKNEAEVFYHPGTSKNQSIFLRFKTFNNLSNNEAFYQLQFGYRFSIGVSKITQ